MAGTTKCLKFVRGRAARFTRLNGCGVPVYGEASTVTTEGIITIGYTANIDEGDEINVPNFAGVTCVLDTPAPQLTGYTLEIQFCEVDPELYALATGQAVVLDAFGNAVGFDVDTSVSSLDTAFALEVWAGAPAQRCAEGGTGSFGYFLAPFVQGGVLGDFTIENGAVTFTISNATTKQGNAWGVGPYDVTLDASSVASPLLTAIGTNVALRAMIVNLDPPEAECGSRPLLDPTDAVITSVGKTVDHLQVTFAPTPSGSDPWWIDFGDGTWDYQASGASIVHTYAAAGTYNYVAYRGTSTLTGTAVPVP